MKLVLVMLLAMTITAMKVQAATPQKKVVLVTCMSKRNQYDKFQMTVSIVAAQNSVQQTTLRIQQENYVSNGEYQPNGEFFHATSQGLHEEIYVSWGIMKTGSGDVVVHPTTPQQIIYSCQPYGYQG